MEDPELEELILHLSENPMAGDVIVGTGGCRKLRWRRHGRGKSGGYRTITFYSGEAMPVFLLAVFAKGERSDLNQDERNQLKRLTSAIVGEYAARAQGQ